MIKQHIIKKPMGQQGNPRRNQMILRQSENGTTTYQNLQDAAKVVLRAEFAATQVYLKTRQSQIGNLT